MNLSIGKKIGIGFGVMFLLIVILGTTCFVSLQTAKTKLAEIQAARQRSELTTTAALSNRGLAAALNGVIAYGDEKFYQRVDQEMKNMMDAQKQLLEVIPEEKKADVQKLIEVTAKAKDNSLNLTVPLSRALQKETAAGNAEGIRNVRDQLGKATAASMPIYATLTKITYELKAYNDEDMQKSTEAAIAVANRVMITAVVLSLIAALIGSNLGECCLQGKFAVA